jgi:hypothetical protein
MSGFPTRPSLTTFGAKRVDRSAVRSAIHDASARLVNLLRAYVAGLGQSSSRAWALCTVSGTTITLTAQGNGWSGSAPTPLRTGTGVYTLTYAATVTDDDGEAVSPNLLGAVVSPRAGANPLTHDWDITDGRIVTVRLFRASTGAAEDGSFFVALY